MPETVQQLQELTVSGVVPLVLLTAVGVLLWAAGRRVLRAGLILIGLIIGGGIGWLLASQVSLGGLPQFVPAAVVGISFAAIASMTYRVAIAGSLALILALAAPLAVISVAEFQGRYTPEVTLSEVVESIEAPPTDEISEWLRPDGEDAGGDDAPKVLGQADAPADAPETGSDVGDVLDTAEALGGVRSFVDSIIDAALDWWAGTPDEIRPQLIMSSVIGSLLGILLGALAPNICSAVVTSFGGSLLWLGSSRLLLIGAGFGEAAMMPRTGRVWLALWIIIALVGMGIQWMIRPKEADKAT